MKAYLAYFLHLKLHVSHHPSNNFWEAGLEVVTAKETNGEF
jgi:hypothetical protein